MTDHQASTPTSTRRFTDDVVRARPPLDRHAGQLDRHTSVIAPSHGPIGPSLEGFATVNGDTRPDEDIEVPPGAPRWVKVFAIGGVVLLLLLAGLHLTGNAPTHMTGSSGAEHGMQAP